MPAVYQLAHASFVVAQDKFELAVPACILRPNRTTPGKSTDLEFQCVPYGTFKKGMSGAMWDRSNWSAADVRLVV